MKKSSLCAKPELTSHLNKGKTSHFHSINNHRTPFLEPKLRAYYIKKNEPKLENESTKR
jgi:hypothetical protein